MEITSPHAFARIVEAARRLDDELSGRDEKHAVIAFQALAGLDRTRAPDGIDRRRHRGDTRSRRWRTSLIRTAASAPCVSFRDYHLAGDDAARCAAAAGAARSMDHGGHGLRIAAAAGAAPGQPSAPNAPTMSWEGLNYRIDLFAAEHARLKRIREQLRVAGA